MVRSLEELHERVKNSLSGEFGGKLDFGLGDSAADVLIEQGDKVAIVEISIGDPGFSLPSSTSSRMRFLRNEAGRRFAGKQILPILVTNYRVTQPEEDHLQTAGIALVPLANSNYQPKDVFASIKEKIGLSPKPAEDSPAGEVVA